MIKAKYLQVINAIYNIIEKDTPIILGNKNSMYRFINDDEFVELFKIVCLLDENNLVDDLLKTTFLLLHDYIENILAEYKNTELTIKYFYNKSIIPFLCKDINKIIYDKLSLKNLDYEEYKFFKKCYYLSRLFKYLDMYYLVGKNGTLIYERKNIKIYFREKISHMFKDLWQQCVTIYNH